MKNSIIKNKSFAFALKIIKLSPFLVEGKKEFVLSKQILRSGTSIGALVCESEHAESTADFIHKLAVAQKETNETNYWVELLFQAQLISEKIYTSLSEDITELRKILASILITSKKKL